MNLLLFVFLGSCVTLAPGLRWHDEKSQTHATEGAFTVYTAELTQLGSSGVSATVTVFTSSSGLFGAGVASGLETGLDAVAGADCTAPNGCGAHVHSGDGCEATSQGGHYYSGSLDPWKPIGYSSTDAGGGASFSFVVMDGATDIEGKPFIIHNNAGARVACGILSEATTGITHASLEPLSDSGVQGSVTLYTAGNMITGAGVADGLEPSLSDATNGGTDCTATNGCGAHVHSGDGCEATSQGGHYFNGAVDPWGSIRYSSTSASGTGRFAFVVVDDATDVADKPFIVHNNAGGRVACGLLQSQSTSATGTGDPHMKNMWGNSFDISRAGDVPLIKVAK